MRNKFKLTDGALASRRSAAALRNEVEEALLGGHAVIDFSLVESLSESFADELFGVLMLKHGLGWVFERLELLAVRPVVVQTIVSALRYRLSAGGEADVGTSLLIARQALLDQRSHVT